MKNFQKRTKEEPKQNQIRKTKKKIYKIAYFKLKSWKNFLLVGRKEKLLGIFSFIYTENSLQYAWNKKNPWRKRSNIGLLRIEIGKVCFQYPNFCGGWWTVNWLYVTLWRVFLLDSFAVFKSLKLSYRFLWFFEFTDPFEAAKLCHAS